MKIFNQISPETFFSEYWQKKPLIIRAAFSKDLALISPEELAGYSLDEEIESRLITCPENLDSNQDDDWQLEQGPLEESTFAEIDGKSYTLLVQSLDYFHPPLHELIKACNFIPRWRLDDVMVSYATDGAGVGPHLDKYDVFLIQGEGQRRWRVGHKDQATKAYTPHPQIGQIEAFQPDFDEVLETGDLLYIPPNTPHWGTSIDNSICYSVGFRAPSIGNIMQNMLNQQSPALDSLWTDGADLDANGLDGGSLKADSRFGQLEQPIVEWAKQAGTDLLSNNSMSLAIGQLVTELKYPEVLEPIAPCEANELAEAAFIYGVCLNPLARICFFETENTLLTFINGEAFEQPKSLKPLLEKLNFNQVIEPQECNIADKEALRGFFSQAFELDALLLNDQ